VFYGDITEAHKGLLQQIATTFPTAFGRCYFGDNNILVGKNLSYLDDPKFVETMNRQAANRQEQSLMVRMNTLVWAFEHALHIEGDIVECGVWKGFSFRFLTDFFNFSEVSKTLWLYDTFDGIPPEYDAGKHDAVAYHEPGLYEGVVASFAAFPNVKVVRGALPGSLENASPDKIALLHLDLNSARGEVETLDALFDRVSPGGMIVFDDYGWQIYKAQHEAEKAWAAARGYRILETPNGQGVLLKR
jgi:hypothetical protein